MLNVFEMNRYVDERRDRLRREADEYRLAALARSRNRDLSSSRSRLVALLRRRWPSRRLRTLEAR